MPILQQLRSGRDTHDEMYQQDSVIVILDH